MKDRVPVLTRFRGQPPSLPPEGDDALSRLRAALAVWAQAYALADRATHGLLHRLARAWTNFNDRGARQAASLAYYAIFSLFPLLLLAVAAIGGLVGPTFAQEQVLQVMETFLPGETLTVIERNVALALEQGQSFGLVALIGLIWAAGSLFSNLSVALDIIFQPTRPPRSMWHKRFMSLMMTLTLVVLLSSSLITSIAFRLLSILLRDRPNTLLAIGTLILPLGFNVAIFALLFRYVPRVTVRWDAVWPAALAGGLGWEVAKNLFVWYIDNLANFSLIYGSLGTVIALLVWAYLTAAILLLSAEVCAALNDWLAQREAPS